ncbi:hypothetical protein [Ramlibacter sp. AN1133]|uniref:hypothetical protein n=1 Tax=Ramlibacter sp. AN1133 TaxID=3133429 RepID=UPI0030C2DF10
MVDRAVNGLPTFDNPFEQKDDRFSVWGYRKMALYVLSLTLEELTWDPQAGRSVAERAEMQQAKDAAAPWFDSDAFVAFATLAQLPISTHSLRQRCLQQPRETLEQLRAIRNAMDETRVSEQQRQAVAAMAPQNLPANNWVFSDVLEGLSASVEAALLRAQTSDAHGTRHQVAPEDDTTTRVGVATGEATAKNILTTSLAPLGRQLPAKQGFLFDEISTAQERVAWNNVARQPVRHRVTQ